MPTIVTKNNLLTSEEEKVKIIKNNSKCSHSMKHKTLERRENAHILATVLSLRLVAVKMTCGSDTFEIVACF